MKYVLIAVVVCALCGCVGLTKVAQSTEDFFTANPTIDPLDMRNIDDDGDGAPDAFGLDEDHDGRLDVVDGVVFEVPGTRESLDTAGETDRSISESLVGMGELLTIFGLPGGLLVIGGRKWGKHQPTKHGVSLVWTIQKIRERLRGGHTLTLDDVTAIAAAENAQVTGLTDFVKKVKSGVPNMPEPIPIPPKPS